MHGSYIAPVQSEPKSEECRARPPGRTCSLRPVDARGGRWTPVAKPGLLACAGSERSRPALATHQARRASGQRRVVRTLIGWQVSHDCPANAEVRTPGRQRAATASRGRRCLRRLGARAGQTCSAEPPVPDLLAEQDRAGARAAAGGYSGVTRVDSERAPRSVVPGGAVEALAQQVGVAVVARVFLDHVRDDPAQRPRLAGAIGRLLAGSIQARRFREYLP
jgi:hypothetical protein